MCKKIIWLTIGKIVAPQGLSGKVRINPSSDFPERFIKSGDRWLQYDNEEPQKIQLNSGRQIPGKSIYVVEFQGIDDREKAKALVGKKLLIDSSHRPTLAPGEFHLLDLLGLKVRLKNDHREIGEVTNLTSAGNDLLEVRLLSGKKVLVPFVKEIVPEIKLQEGWLMVCPPPGLFDL
ncbi:MULTISPECIES: ribosome maturation factor RimM [Prochlorococcus]|uniref:Ribosome maturation factor RimM n=2 Tax=Prochlorococcus marinus TaxID=1219 RepID=RIMM_PROMA|nr:MULTISPECIES: ribosome maturation factor RimM [Prochlorococcus]Q7V9R4.1 RecName: Full=Ribosome maturation factor RimM [Prochlorococcus marinus subsp. marinus str. CCMP1375]AAQ00808.1 RimM protein, required for 16S rRNA processing [Prochlorococcus marinus subsp. marinus str. CCMP1375]KGG10697.1 16S rRNA processing protein RimM [Prochlorococcus marinus str. LG]KGG21118.1 16S rRNA processing protein RimM [Prochlorococcus marinus str. SS2]KGG23943.1 16S rRNA processing protein RimM [Prochloroco